jgi:phage shock protein A
MGLFQRVGDFLAANLNDMVERFEDPETMLRQAVREMETAIGQAKQETARAMASEKLAGKSLAEHRRQAQDWQQRAERAVQAGDDVLARKALSRKHEYDRMVAALQDQAAAAAETSQTLRRQLYAMQAKLAEAKRRLGALVARQRAAEVRSRLQTAAGVAEVDPSAFEKFERLRQKVEQAEAETEALRELDAGTVPQAEPEPAPANAGLEAELASLKRRLGKG